MATTTTDEIANAMLACARAVATHARIASTTTTTTIALQEDYY